MKRMIWAGLSLAVLLGMGVSSAGERNITFHAGAVGGLYMEPGIIWAEAIQKDNPDIKLSCILGGGTTNAIAVAKGQPNENMGMVDDASALSAVKGEGEFATRIPGGTKALRAVLRFNVPSWLSVLVRPEAVPEGVRTLKELLDKNPEIKIALKPRGSGDDILAQRLFATYGYSYDSLKARGTSITFNNTSDIGILLVDGHADATINMTRIPAAFVLDMESAIPDLRWLEVDRKSVDTLVEKYGYSAGIHPRGIYSTLKEDLYSVASDHFVIAHEDMDEELVYRMAKAMLKQETVDRLKVAVPALQTFDREVAGVKQVLPLHKGAIRAYEELGLPYDK